MGMGQFKKRGNAKSPITAVITAVITAREYYREAKKQKTIPQTDSTAVDHSSSTNILILVYFICVCFLPIHSGHQVRWTYQPGSHRRKVTQDF